MTHTRFRTVLLAFTASAFISVPAFAADYTVLQVGNEKIKSSEITGVWQELFPEGAAPDFETFDENIRQNVLRGVASERLIYDEAVKAGLDKDKSIERRIENAKKQIVMQAFMDKKAKSLVSDADLKAAYKKKQDEAKNIEEVKARHILVATEDEAKDLLKSIKEGGDFNKIAKEKSTDKGSGTRGGDLGWFTKDKMVPEFGAAAFALKEGELSKPVKSPFGWHIIKLEDRRTMELPSFEEMKETLRGELTNQRVQDYVESLLTKADITYYGADGKERELKRQFTTDHAAPAAGAKKE